MGARVLPQHWAKLGNVSLHNGATISVRGRGRGCHAIPVLDGLLVTGVVVVSVMGSWQSSWQLLVMVGVVVASSCSMQSSL